MKRIAYTECANCGLRGPEAEFNPEALKLADSQGWLIRNRMYGTDDYCPACRAPHEERLCETAHKGATQSLATYSLQTFRDDVACGEPMYTCGIHSQQMMRDMFAGGADSIMVVKIAQRLYRSKRK